MSGAAGGLGRGLGSLIPARPADDTGDEPSYAGPQRSGPAAELADVAGAVYREIPVDRIRANPRQPRTDFDEDQMGELVASIREVGLLQPVVVRRAEPDGYELVMGERRWRAATRAGLATLPAIVKDTADDDLLRDALLENLHRAQLNPLEEAAAYQQLLDDFGCTHEELAARIGRSRPHITNTVRLLRLTPPVQRRVAAGVLSAGHARALLSVEDAEEQERLAGRAVAEAMSVRGLEEVVAMAQPPRRRATRSPGAAGEDLCEVADRLCDHLDTRCRVEQGRSRGRIVVEFATREDLGRIVALITAG